MTTTVHTIPATDRIDPITLVVVEHDPGRYTIIVKCYDCAWACYWGSTGTDTLAAFLKSVSANYVANSLISGRNQWISNKRKEDLEFAYLKRIAQVIVDAAKGGAL